MYKTTMDGNTAAAYVSYAFSELAVVYPITPSSPMAELAETWQAAGRKNLFGDTLKVVQMQSEAGAAGALHGALTCGALATTYTCSQGLLLMQPNMYKIAGELLPTVFHVSARALAAHALNIFGDHQDVMAVRQTGFAFLASASVQETMDLALVAHLSALRSSVPFVHFFDGFRTSHEMSKIEAIGYDEMRSLLDTEDIRRFKERALSPLRPVARGTTQNPDVYFQNREAANPYYLALPDTVQGFMDKLGELTGRRYRLFDYFGAADAERVLVAMGSACSTAEETIEKMNADGEKVGLAKVRLYRPFHAAAFCAALPPTCKRIAVLDRTKEAGAPFEPLCLDVCAALGAGGLSHIRVFGGRYGLGMKEFTPTTCRAVFDNLALKTPKNHFTVGICDDVSFTSLDISKRYDIPAADTLACKFYGLGSDGTVGANKNSVKLVGDKTDLFVQGYFCYDSRKSGGATVSHLRFSRSPIRSAYLIDRADFIACHDPSYLVRFDMLSDCKENGVFLLNCPWTGEELERRLPAEVKRQIAAKRLSFYVVDATAIANGVGLSGRTSTVMQAAFFLLQPRLLPYETAIGYLKQAIKEKFARKGGDVVAKNVAAIDKTREAVQKIDYPREWEFADEGAPLPAPPKEAYVRDFIRPVLALQGDRLPVSAFRADGSVPTGTSKFEKHGMPYLLPRWLSENCIQCNQCSFVCPHACIRPFAFDGQTQTPRGFDSIPAVGLKNARFRIQVAAHDCMGCGVCANVCPAPKKALVMTPSSELPGEGARWEFAEKLTQVDTGAFKRTGVKGSQFVKPLFEFSYACSGCGETPYLKVLTQLFGERLLIANATGCSSIYGGSAPTCPYAKNGDGQGPAWANSLFEDNAEFGYGMRLASELKKQKPDESVWIVGGDGWAYDIGFGGLDHVLASGANVNILVLDSEVYSNTGGQLSKATPTGAVARFAVSGNARKKKELGLMAMSYGSAYVAQVSMGANKAQLLQALTEAEAYDGPSLVIAYSPCIAHGVHMSKCMEEEARAVQSGYWQLYRFDPAKKAKNENPFSLDSPEPTLSLREFYGGENRFASLIASDPERAETLLARAEKENAERRRLYQRLVALYEP